MDIRKENTACADSAQTEMLKEAIHIVREDFLKTCKGESSSIEHIERLAEYAYRTICSQMEPLESHYSCAFTNQDVFRLENLAVAIYLEEWLENDENARQTIYSFADRKYVLQSEYEWGSTCEDEAATKRLRTAENVFVDMERLWERHTVEEKSPCKSLLKKEKTKCAYDFISLNFMDLYAQGKLLLYRLLVLRKNIMDATSDKGSNKNLDEAYHLYDSIFEDAKKASNREYVVTSMQMRRLESTYRFHLAAKLARLKKDCRVATIPRLPNMCACWGRYRSYTKFSPQQGVVNVPYDVLNYEEEILAAMGDKQRAMKIFLWRDTLLDVLMLMNGIESPLEMASWSTEDFRNAAEFYRRKYPIVESYQSIDLGIPGKNTDSCYPDVRKFYEKVLTQSGSSLEEFRKNMRENHRNRNCRNRKR